MKKLTLAFLALALAAAPLGLGCKKSHDAGTTMPGAGDTITVPLAARTVGVRWTKTDDVSTQLHVVQGDQSADIGSKRHHVTASEILAVDGAGLITKVAVTYQERTDETVGNEPSPPSVLVGKSYVVSVAGGAVAATRADGSAVSAAELVELTDDQDDLGKAPVMEQLMARTWKRGERVELTADELQRYAANKGAGPRATAMAFTLEGVAAGKATFAMTMTMTGDGDVAFDITGKVVVDAASGRPDQLQMHGPVSGMMGDAKVTGTLTGNVVYQFAN